MHCDSTTCSNQHPPPNSKAGQEERAKRFALLIKILKLEDLNEDEKLSLFEYIDDYLYQFHLPGDKLGATNVVTHKIVTTDDRHVFYKN